MKESIPARNLTAAAMFAALTFLATSVLKIPTPGFGYIHTGDAFVLLSGIFLGPVSGALAAGTGSALADLLGGYIVWVPATFIVKFLTAACAAVLYRALSRRTGHAALVLSGLAGEAVMTAGYFLAEICMIAFAGGSLSAAGLASAAAVSASNLPFNLLQGACGIVLSLLLLPVFSRISRQLLSPAGS